MHGAKFRQVFHNRIIKFEQATVTELHNGNSCEGFGDRSPMEYRFLVNHLLFLLVRHSIEIPENNLVVMHEKKATADDPMMLKSFFVKSLERFVTLLEIIF